MAPSRGPARGASRLASTVASLWALAPCAAAAEPKPPRAVLANDHYTVDLYQGPVLAPIGVTAIAGSYAAIAEGITGQVANAAAPAVRDAFSVSRFEYDGAGSISIPFKVFDNNDFQNTGRLDLDYSNFFYATFGGVFQLDEWGLGANGELYRYTLGAPDGSQTNVYVGKYHLLGAVRLLGDQLVVGGGARFLSLNLAAPSGGLAVGSAAPEVGVLIRPDWESFRIGATYRGPVDGGKFLGSATSVGARGVELAGPLILPDHIVLPWELELGVAVQVGPRPLNPVWIDPRAQEAEVRAAVAQRRKAREAQTRAELARLADPLARAALARELAEAEEAALARDRVAERVALAGLEDGRRARAANWPRQHLLLTAELLVTGAVDRGVGLERFLGQSQGVTAPPGGYSCDEGALAKVCPTPVGSSGASTNFSPRFGIETEPVPGLVHTLFGSYYEPSRFRCGAGSTPGACSPIVGRQHFTFGGDVRLFSTTWFGLVREVVYKLQASMDAAPRYQSLSLGFGVWH